MDARKGDWVQIRDTVLEAGERAPQVPADTAGLPLLMWVKGFLQDEEASIGAEVAVVTMSGRTVRGTMTQVNPRYTHDFGACVPELLQVHRQVKRLAGLEDDHE